MGPLRKLEVDDWGLVPYGDALDRQLACVDQRKAGERSDTLVLTEHPPVYTFGVRKTSAEHLLLSKERLKAKGIELYATRRGGDVTYHGPGQLVGYPILALKEMPQADLHAYLRDIEEVLIGTLSLFGLPAGRRDGMTGIWLENRKIAAIGVAVKHWITYHGFALNVSNDLAPFKDIVPCGIGPEQGSITSIKQELGGSARRAIASIRMDELKAALVDGFCERFGYPLPTDREQPL
ncbi:MAG: lipoyl(octanoyl) transferase LipB [Opitutales bacterium]